MNILLYLALCLALTNLYADEPAPVLDSHLFCKSSKIEMLLPEKNYLFSEDCSEVFVYPYKNLTLTLLEHPNSTTCKVPNAKVNYKVLINNGFKLKIIDSLNKIDSPKINIIEVQLSTYFFHKPIGDDLIITANGWADGVKEDIHDYVFFIADDYIELDIKISSPMYCDTYNLKMNHWLYIRNTLNSVNFHRNYNTKYDKHGFFRSIYIQRNELIN